MNLILGVKSMYLSLMAQETELDFSSLEACIRALYAARWPEGFRCPYCEHSHAYEINTRKLPLYQCSLCERQTSLIAGTVMEGSHTDLRKWMQTMQLVAHASPGISALQLSQIIGVTYKTAWLMLHKLRAAIDSFNGREEPLQGHVQINSAFYGKPYGSVIHEHPQRQPLLIGASIDMLGVPTRIQIMHIPKHHMNGTTVRGSGVQAFIRIHVDPVALRVECNTAHFSSRRFRSLLAVAAQASQWMNLTFHGIGPKYLQRYLEEYIYRYNMTAKQLPVWSNLIRLCASSPRTTYSALTGNRSGSSSKAYYRDNLAS
ncbi:transposase [Paenibacillus filicis]|uniref:Transposase n=1 Tax=Paenibacillus filicis TaxID=669464 RepID=A0ABU9DFX7_9BACL